MASMQADSIPGMRRLDTNARFVTSYGRSFANLPAPSSSLRQVGFLELSSLGGQSSRAPKRTNSAGSLIRPLPMAWQDSGISSLSGESTPLQNIWDGSAQTSSSHGVKCRQVAWDGSIQKFQANEKIDRGSQHILDHTPRKIRRAISELLTNPDVKFKTKHAFDRVSSRGPHHRKGQLLSSEVGRVVRQLIKQFSLPSHCAGIASLLLKRFDMNHDDMFSFEEFF